MKRLTRILAIALVGLAVLAPCAPKTNAGRIGGAMSAYITVAPGESVYSDVALFANQQGIVTVIGNGNTPLDLYVYDGDNHFWVGTGYGDRRLAVMNVYRSGFFRIEVHNSGPVANTFLISSN